MSLPSARSFIGTGTSAQPQQTYPNGSTLAPNPESGLATFPSGQVGPSQSGAPGLGIIQPVQVTTKQVVPTAPPYVPSPVTFPSLDYVSPDEDSVYGPLGRARGKIERALDSDNRISPDLVLRGQGECLQPSLEDTYSRSDAGQPYIPLPQGSPFAPFKLTRGNPLPDALHQEFHCV